MSNNLGVIVFLIFSISILLSNKSSFKIIFSLMCSLSIFVFLKINEYPFAHYYLVITSLLHFVTLVYVKVSQTGKIRVATTQRNKYSNNLMPVLSIILVSIFTLIIIAGVDDEMLNGTVKLIETNRFNLLALDDIRFAMMSSIFILILYCSKRLR
ncbi:hypothetical protein [Halobacteriovorax sp. HLS]|uniref:hypothetical protein n=1 Tax=Halobacteriovorax sp. HLS TaxID=2234000 RepID=UPI000FDB2D02|nr:hypothetical protein [Halobacteriovorax sp. HLS]